MCLSFLGIAMEVRSLLCAMMVNVGSGLTTRLRFPFVRSFSSLLPSSYPAPPGIKKQAIVACGTLGGMAGFFNAYQNSCGRLMGYFPNE